MATAKLFYILSVVIVNTAAVGGGQYNPQEDLHVLLRRDAINDVPTRSTQTLLTFPSASFIELVAVWKRPVPNGNIVTVWYKKHTQDNISSNLYSETDGPILPDDVRDGSHGLTSAIYATATSDSNLYVLFRDSANDHMIAVILNGRGYSTVPETISGQPVVSINPEGEMTYQPGHDLNFAIRVQGSGTFDAKFAGVDLQTRKYHEYLDDENFITTQQQQRHGRTLDFLGTVHTSRRPMSGYLQISTLHEVGGSLLSFIMVIRHLVVKPTGQAGQFPPGYLAITDQPQGRISANGNDLTICKAGQDCSVHCQAVGDDVSKIEVFKVDPHGGYSEVPNAFHLSNEDPAQPQKTVFWKVPAGADVGIITFQCRATDLARDNTVTKLLDVQVIIPPSIDPERSGVIVADDPTSPDEKVVALNCAVQGRPLPTVTFTGSIGSNENTRSAFVDIAPDTVSTVGENEAIASKSFKISVDDFNWIAREIQAGSESAPFCSFWSQNGEYHKFTFQLNEIK